MTRIHHSTNFFKPHALQPSGFIDQGRQRAFAGNHPTEAYKRVHFITTKDSNGGSNELIKISVKILKESKQESERAEATLKLNYIDNEDEEEHLLSALKFAFNDSSDMVKTGAALSALQLAKDKVNLNSLMKDTEDSFDLENKKNEDPTALKFLLTLTYLQQIFNDNQINIKTFNKYNNAIEKKLPIILKNINVALENGTEAEKELNSFYLRCLSQVVDINDSIHLAFNTLKSDNLFTVKNCLKILNVQILVNQSYFQQNDITTALSDLYDRGDTSTKGQIILVINELGREKILTQNGIPILLKALHEKDQTLIIMGSLKALQKANENGLDIKSVREILTEHAESKFMPIKHSANELLRKISSDEN